MGGQASPGRRGLLGNELKDSRHFACFSLWRVAQAMLKPAHLTIQMRQGTTSVCRVTFGPVLDTEM